MTNPEQDSADLRLLRDLEPVVETNLNRHLHIAKAWNPHDYVPYDQGRNFARLGGEDWDPSQSRLSPVAKTAMIVNLLTEDNLPSYHRIIHQRFGRDGAWGSWVGQWTAEEGRHAIAMRDYLTVTRSVDPVALETARMDHVILGHDDGDKTILRTLAYVSFQELATRVSHRNTGKACDDKIADDMLARIAMDENLHMVFYRNLTTAALDLAPNQTMRAITSEVMDFQMPGANMAGFARNALILATAHIYDTPQHLDEVIKPLLRHWKIFEREDLSGDGAQAREELGTFLGALGKKAARFTERHPRIT